MSGGPLYTVADVADLFGVRPATVHSWHHRAMAGRWPSSGSPFPRASSYDGAHPLWLLDDLVAWSVQRPRRRRSRR